MTPLLRFLAVLLLAVTCTASADEKEDREKLKQIGKDILKLEQSIQGDNKEQRQLAAALRKSELAAADLNREIRNLEQQAARLDDELRQLQKRRQELEQSRQAQQQLIAQQVSAAYRLGSQESIKLLLNQEDPDKVSRALKYYDYFLTARAEKISHYLQTIADLQEVEKDINGRQESLAATREDLEEQQQQLAESRRARSDVLARLERQITNSQQSLNQLKGERKRLESVIKALEESLARLASPSNTEPFAKRKGKLPWPVSGQLSQYFGATRTADLTWNGWLLKAKEGTGVHAVHHGRIVFSDYLRGHGLLVIIDHGDGYMSLYAHNQVLLKVTGDWVQSGEIIARVGNSGGQRDHALYFEIRHNGRPTNPKYWLTRKG
ncbi:MAG: ATPase [Gammaproteobacteria bacterium]|nr:MAG: ATPase [Gammaproteobacteria bacterium]